MKPVWNFLADDAEWSDEDDGIMSELLVVTDEICGATGHLKVRDSDDGPFRAMYSVAKLPEGEWVGFMFDLETDQTVWAVSNNVSKVIEELRKEFDGT